MGSRHLPVALTVLAGACGLFLLMEQWVYLGRGYSMHIALEGYPAKAVAITFPLWRRVVTLFIAAMLVTGIVTVVKRKRMAVAILGLAVVAAAAIGFHDVYEYGLIGTPTSLSLVGAMALTWIAASYARRSGAPG